MATNKLEFEITQKGAEKAKQQISGLSGAVTNLAKTFGLAVTAGLAMRKIMQTFSQSITFAREQITVNRMIEQQIRATGGAAGLASKELFSMASGLQAVSNIGDDGILRNLTLPLLTFKQIAGETFERTQQAAMDLNAVIGDPNNPSSLRSSAIMLGKALNDPIAGLTAMRRVGISFTQSQQDVIRSLTETGDLIGAQNMILDEMAAQFGGAAKAGVQAGVQLKNTWDDTLEAFGMIGLPAIEGIQTAINNFLIITAGNIDAFGKSLEESQAQQFRSSNEFTAAFALNTDAVLKTTWIAVRTVNRWMIDSLMATVEMIKSTMATAMAAVNSLSRIGDAIGRATIGGEGLSAFGDALKGIQSDFKAATDPFANALARPFINAANSVEDFKQVFRDYEKSFSTITYKSQEFYNMQQKLMERLQTFSPPEQDQQSTGIAASLDTTVIENYYSRMMHLNASSAQEVIDSHNEMRDSLWQYLEATVTDLKLRGDMYATAEAEIAAAQKARLTEIRQNEIDAERKLAAEMLGIKVAALQDLEGYQSEYLALRFQQIDAETEKLRKAGLDQVTIAAWVASERAKVQSEANPEIETKLTELQEIYDASGRNIRTSLEGTIGNALNGLLTQQRSFADTMSSLWHDLANSVIAEISRMIAKMLVLKIVSSIIGVPAGAANIGSGFGTGAGSTDIPASNIASFGGSTPLPSNIGQTSMITTLSNKIDRLVNVLEQNNSPQFQLQIDGMDLRSKMKRIESMPILAGA